jgi:hypothetical protein
MKPRPKPYTVATFTPNFKQGEEVYFFECHTNFAPRLRKGYIHQPVISNDFPDNTSLRFNQGVCEVTFCLKWEIADDREDALARYAACGATLAEGLIFRSKDEALASLTP